MILRPYQQRVRQEAGEAARAGAQRVAVVMPTGAGKTVTFASIAGRAAVPVLIYAHRRELIRQASAKLDAVGVDHGIIAPGWKPRDSRVQVGSIQTLAGKTLPPFGMLIPDECHHATTPTYRGLQARHPHALMVGFTATPERLDGTGLGSVFDAMVCGPTIPELQAEGHLCPIRVYAPDVSPDPRHPEAGQIVGDIVDHYLWHAPFQPAICFCLSVAAAETAAVEFRARGIAAKAVDGKTNPVARDAAIAGLATGHTEVLCVCDLVSEGLDIPAVSCVILCRSTESLANYLQWCGRGMRPAPGKDYLTVLDHASNALRHGLPGAARTWTLDGATRNPAERVPAIRQCGACYAIHAPAPVCPCCGAVSGSSNTAGPRRVRLADGTLSELTESDVRILATPLRELLAEAKNRDDIDRIGAVRGYKPGWTHIVMKYHRFGAAPDRSTAAEDFAV
jgi:DNA repair protein RadD